MKLAALCLIGCAAFGGAAAAAATPQDTMFVDQAAIGGLSEVQAGQLAQTKATGGPVKGYAAKMIADHMPNNQELATLAASKGLTPPAMPDAEHKAQYDALQASPPASFDATYIRGQVAGHAQMQQVMQQEIQSGTDPDLKAFAQKTLPVVQMHLQMAQQMAAGTAQ